MNLQAVYHEAKSQYAYAYDQKTLHIRLRTAKDDIENVVLIAGNTYDWSPTKEDPTVWEWNKENANVVNMKKEYTTELFDYWFAEIEPVQRRVRYAFVLQNGGEEILFTARKFINITKNDARKYDLIHYFNFPYINPEDLYTAPSWVKDTVWYQIFPERFANGQPENNLLGTIAWGSQEQVSNAMLFGGDLQGITDHLEYITDLGVTGIYFTPIFEAPTIHKYDTANYFKIDPAFGSNEAFKILVDEAHKRGLKVMLDAVFNHCGWNHPFWQDVVKNGKSSKYYDCFFIHADPVINFSCSEKGYPIITPVESMNLNYDTFAYEPTMPKWNTAHPLVREHLLSAAKYWIEEYDIDGWRLDVSNEVSHDFWRQFRKTVREVKPDLFILGENWDNSTPWLQGDQFDAVMNYELVYPIWLLLGEDKIFKGQSCNVAEFKDAVNTLLVTYPKYMIQNMFNLLDSHDTSRILTICKGDIRRVLQAYVIQMTLAGSPSIYYGSEIGLEGKDEDNRRCMIWEPEKQKLQLKEHVKKLIQLRKDYAACKAVDIQWMDVNEKDNYLIYRKQSEEQSILIVLNLNQDLVEIHMQEGLKHKEYTDLYTDQIITVRETLKVPERGFYLLLENKIL